MLELFSSTLGVLYPWAQYAQTSVDDFVAGGMENTSATTLSVRDLVNPKLAPEMRIGDDTVISHELAHQWFGDLVTCKDWANLWLNEGFASYFEHFWLEKHYSRDEADYQFWRDQQRWFARKTMFPVPILTRDFDDSTKYDGNVYDKASWVLRMLREQLGDANFFRALNHYLEANRGQNVVTADLQRAIEQSTSINVDHFFDQWIYGAGAPEFQVSDSYDAAAHELMLNVAQTQKQEGKVGIFDVPIDVEIATANGSHTYTVETDEAIQSFRWPLDGPPLMIVFDRGDKILKTLDFKREPALLTYQLKHGETAPDRADAAVSLGAVKNDSGAVLMLGDAAQHDPFWGVRVEALRALGKIGGDDAEKQIIAALGEEKPWVREIAVRTLGEFKEDASIGPRLTSIAANDPAYRVRAAALLALGQVKAPHAFDLLAATVNSDSPDDILRDAALDGLGPLGDARAVPILSAWSAPGKPIDSREEAISALAELDKTNPQITQTIISYLHDTRFDLRITAILALGARGDATAVGPLEDMRTSGGITMGEAPYLDMALALLKRPPASH